jgi:hypothetical protein
MKNFDLKYKRPIIALLVGLAWLRMPVVSAQQLDMEFLHQGKAPNVPKVQDVLKPLKNSPAKSAQTGEAVQIPTGMKPLTATVSKTLYLPPEMYGQWTVTGIVKETNISNLVPMANDIWILQRQGDAVVITNPANGASAAVNVDNVEGNTATFHRSGQSGKMVRSETVTLTVNGDQLYGKNMRREEVVKNGQVVKVNYALFELQGVRISGASAVFRPEAMDSGPDIEIEEVRKAR